MVLLWTVMCVHVYVCVRVCACIILTTIIITSLRVVHGTIFFYLATIFT